MALRMGSRGWTEASLRDHFRARVVALPRAEQLGYAYSVLSQVSLAGTFNKTQMKAVAKGLQLGLKDGAR